MLSQQAPRMTAAKAATLVRPQPERYKSQRERNKRLPIKVLLREAKAGSTKLQLALDWLHTAVMLPLMLMLMLNDDVNGLTPSRLT